MDEYEAGPMEARVEKVVAFEQHVRLCSKCVEKAIIMRYNDENNRE